MPKVSVCVPIYNVEKYIEKCARSLFEQTLDDIEYIFVNDCTPDNSLDILQRVLDEYPQRKSQVLIISHDANKGIASVRNTGLKQATAKYLIYCDGDDWVEPDMYQKLYEKAEDCGADMVWCNYDTTLDPIQKFSPTTEVQLSGEEYIKLICLGQFHGSTCNKLIKKDIYDKYSLSFPDGYNMMEDVTVIFQILHYAQKIINVPQILYHYVQHGDSITRAPHVIDIIQNVSKISRFYTEHYKGNQGMIQYLYWYQQCNKFNLISSNSISYTEFRSLWKEASKVRLILSNPVLKWYNKLIYIGLCYNITLLFKCKQRLVNIIH